MKACRVCLRPATTFALLVSWRLLTAVAAYAQLSITFPVAQTVFQRNNSNQTYLTIIGLCADPTDRVDCRLSALNAGQGQSTDWQVLDGSPTHGRFDGRVLANGGWYRVEVRSWRDGNVVASSEVVPVGVGEVFAVAGQSNGQGIRDRNAVNPTDERVVCSPHANQTDTTRLPLPFVSERVSAAGVISPRGLTSWCWGRLGDRLAARLNVPVMFFNSAWSGTAVRNWRESITADSTATSYNEFFRPGMPYGNLKRIVQDYAPLTGLRAVLWHQGEAEFYDTDPSASRYAADLETVIRQSRLDAGFDMAWMVARASMDNNLLFNYNYTHYDPVVSAQNQVIQQVSRVYAGPDTDVLQMPRTDGVHFSDDGLRIVGDAWNDSMNDDFFRNTTPMMPSAVQGTDLRLAMQVDNPAPSLNTPVRITMTVHNDGRYRVTNIGLRSELPAPLVFVGGENILHKRGLILAAIPELQPGQAASVSFFAQPSQEGTYQLAAEIARADQLDSDSRPNTSIGDGQDDLAKVSFRTRGGTTQQFSRTVSVNAPPLPTVASNGPQPGRFKFKPCRE